MSEADLYGLPDDIGSHKWKDLARALGFHRASIEAIQQEKGNSKECCIEILVRWLRQNGTGATAGKLAEALTKIGLKNLADRFPIKPSDTNRRVSLSDLFFGLRSSLPKPRENEGQRGRLIALAWICHVHKSYF